jgi:general secretion pathway protein C
MARRRAHGAPVVLVALGVCAWLHARAASALMGAGFAVPPTLPALAPPPALTPSPSHDADPILARNPFDSETGSLLEVASPDDWSSSSDFGIRACTGVRVMGIVAADDPAWSLALLDVQGEREPLLRRAGGDVVAIDAWGVVLDRGGARCLAMMFAPAQGPAPAPSPATPHGAKGIVSTGPGSYAVDRGTRDALIDGAGDLMRFVAVRPEKVGDDVVGLRITTLKPGTLLDAMGIRVGDVLKSVNGIAFTGPDKMLEALARIRTADRIAAVIVRDGHETQLDYTIR